jgi:hypothetical protein
MIPRYEGRKRPRSYLKYAGQYYKSLGRDIAPQKNMGVASNWSSGYTKTDPVERAAQVAAKKKAGKRIRPSVQYSKRTRP